MSYDLSARKNLQMRSFLYVFTKPTIDQQSSNSRPTKIKKVSCIIVSETGSS